MVLHHLRRNAVAYLALAVACTTGTAYAADKLADGSVTSRALAKDAVTKPKIKKSAVTSKAIKNGSVAAADLAPGVLTTGSWVDGATLLTGTNVLLTGNPSSTPDLPNRGPFAFSLPRSGSLQAAMHFDGLSGTCSAGPFKVGLYVDGDAVPSTQIEADSSPQNPVLVGHVTVAAGPHTVTYAMDCPTGNVTSFSPGGSAWLLALD